MSQPAHMSDAPGSRSLPRPATVLIGREVDIGSICERFERGARLVTLTGPGGVGKTRLALAVVDRLAVAFPDGIEFVALASIPHHRLVIPTIARMLGVAEQTARNLLDQLSDHLREQRMLLVLDNLEHVITAATSIADLLQRCPGLRILATSREPLRLTGEWEYAVAPLPVPEPAASQPVGEIASNDAVRLFVERATGVSSRFVLTDANAQDVSAICHHVGGLPLAIELAAARIRVLSPADLLARLKPAPGGGSLALLTGGPRDAPDRQQTMRNTVAWSYDLLTDAEQRFFRQAAIFTGGWTMDAIEAVAEQADVLTLLSSLVDKSIVQHLDRPSDPARYSLLEPIRQFGLELLAQDRDEYDAVRSRHARYMLSLVEGLHERLDAPDAAAWYARIESELDNLRNALNWTMERGDTETGLLIAGELGKFLHQRGYVTEAITHLEALLSVPESIRPTRGRAWAAYSLSWLKEHIGQPDQTVALASEAVEIFDTHGDRFNLGRSLMIRGNGYRLLENDELALADQQRALPLLRAAGSNAYTIRVLLQLAILARRMGDSDSAHAYVEEAYALAQDADLPSSTVLTLRFIGQIAEDTGDDERAIQHYHERLRLNLELGMVPATADTLEDLARIAHRRGQSEHAACMLGSAAILRVQSGSPLVITNDVTIDAEVWVVRDALPGDVFQRAWERGQAMTMAQAIEYVLNGGEDGPPSPQAAESVLTRRERDVIRLLVDGKSNQEIAADLFISPNTVTTHVANIMNKLGFDSRTAVATWAVRNGIV